MQVFLYSYKKRNNSTAQPLPSEGKVFTCQLKEETSFINPVLIFAPETLTSGLFSPAAYNYAQIPYWQRFYYITDWQYINGCWQCSLSVDVLASFRGEIGNTSAYIIRSDAQYNGNITDTFYPATTVKGISKIIVNSEIYRKTIPGGSFILGVINADSNNAKVGAVTYYVLTSAQLVQILSYLFSGNIYQASNITEMGEGLYKSLFDPFQYIVSCMWMPYPNTSFCNPATDAAEVKVGYWSTGVSGYVATQIVKQTRFHSDIAIPNHPQSSRGAYLNKAPYTVMTLFYPPFGEIPIDSSFAQYNNNYLSGIMYLDAITGVADLYVTITDGYDSEQSADYYRYMTMRSSQVGVPIQLAQIMTDYISTLSNAGQAVSSLLSFNLADMFTNICSAVQTAMPKMTTSGSNGAFIEILEPPLLIVEYLQIASENRTEFGRPLCETRTINTLSGYIQCGEDDHSFTCTAGEREQINNYMKNGFFYE